MSKMPGPVMAAGIMWITPPPSKEPAARATSGNSNFLSVASFKKSVTLPMSAITLINRPLLKIQRIVGIVLCYDHQN